MENHGVIREKELKMNEINYANLQITSTNYMIEMVEEDFDRIHEIDDDIDHIEYEDKLCGILDKILGNSHADYDYGFGCFIFLEVNYQKDGKNLDEALQAINDYLKIEPKERA